LGSSIEVKRRGKTNELMERPSTKGNSKFINENA